MNIEKVQSREGENWLEMKNVEKIYDGFRLDCSMKLPKGRITGLVGANGAGKSTAFKAILDVVHLDGGDIRVFGKNPENLTGEEKERIGVVLAESGFTAYITVKDITKIMKSMYRAFDNELFVKKCKEFGLPMDKKIKEFSTGMKSKLKMLLAVSHNADILILDEPTSGLDVVARDEMLNMLREYMEQDENRSILISSHISSDLENLCDDLYIIDEGSIVLYGETYRLTEEYGIIKMDEEQFERIEKKHIIRYKKENYGYSCLTAQRSFFSENYPELTVQKGKIDDIILLMIGGKSI